MNEAEERLRNLALRMEKFTNELPIPPSKEQMEYMFLKVEELETILNQLSQIQKEEASEN